MKRNAELETQEGNIEDTSVLTFNINKLRKKHEELAYNLNKHRPTIVCLQETHVQANDRSTYIHGYRIEEVRAGDSGNGLITAVRNDCNYNSRLLEKSENTIVTAFTSHNTKFVVANVYVPCNGQRRKQVKEEIKTIFQKYKTEQLLVVGDWNQEPSKTVKMINRIGINVYHAQVPKRGTRIRRDRTRTAKAIDYGVSNTSSMIKSHTNKRNWNLSDHVPALLKLDIRHKTRAVIKKLIFDREKLKDPKVKKAIKDIDPELDTTEDAQESINRLNEEIEKILKETKVVRNKKIFEHKAELPSKVKKLIEDKNSLNKEVRRGSRPLRIYKEAHKRLQLELTRLRRRRYLNKIEKGIDHIRSSDYRQAWRWIKQFSGSRTKTRVSQVLTNKKTGIITSDPVEIKSIWREHFQSLCSRDTNEKLYEYNCSGEELQTDNLITMEEMQFELAATSRHKAAGNDNIPSELYLSVLKDPQCKFAKALLTCINRVFMQGTCPKQWEDCTVVPIYKKGDATDTSNYRGIALINTQQKLLCKIIARRLSTVCEEQGLIRKEQAGFTRTGECPSQVAALLECCQRRKIRNQDTILCFLDLKKAYDLVPHNRLIQKLRSINIGKKLISFIENMYANTRIVIRAGDITTDAFRYERGVRQGCPTSPILFNIYINDLLDKIGPINVDGLCKGLKGLMFADDTVIAATSYEDITRKINIVKEWLINNSMELNPSKSGVMHIKHSITSEDIPPLKYDNEDIPKTNTYIYLGVEFNESLNLDLMAVSRVQKGFARVNEVADTLRNKSVPLEYKRMIIGNVLIPTVGYGSEIFGMSETRTRAIKRVLDYSLANVLGTKNYCRNRAYEEFNLTPVQVRAAMSRARGFYKWKDSRGLIRDLIETAQDFKCQKDTWCKGTRKWLKRFKIEPESNSLGRKEVLANYVSRIEKRDKAIATKLAKEYKIKSGKHIRRLEIRNKLKPLGTNQLTKIRTGTFLFTDRLIQMGKIKPDLKNKCVCCKKDTQEDIAHLFLECEAFREERKILKLKAEENSPQNKKKVIIKILGGDSPASGKMPLTAVVKSTDYLSLIAGKRASFIAACKPDL